MNIPKNNSTISLLAISLIASTIQNVLASEIAEQVKPTVLKTKNPDIFGHKLEDLECRITGNLVDHESFEIYSRWGGFGPKAVGNSRVYDTKEGYLIGLFHNETSNSYTKVLLKKYELKTKPLGIACVCAEQGAYAMSKILGCEKLVAPNYVAFNKNFEDDPDRAYSIQFIVEANISYQRLPPNVNATKEAIASYKSRLYKESLEKLSIEDRSHLFLFRFCLGSEDHHTENVLFHKVKDEVKPILIDFEDIATTKENKRSKKVVQSMCKSNLTYSRRVVDLYKSLSVGQLKQGFQEGIKYAPEIYNDEFFNNIIKWKNELLEYIEQQTKVGDQ